MFRIKYKKAVALVFLMELILLVGFVTLLFLAAGRVVSNDAKYYELDAKNLALFLERTSSIDGNFYHVFEFYNNSNVKVTESEVLLGFADKSSYDFSSKYHTLRSFRTTFEYEDVSQLHMYKIGSKILVKEEPDETLDLRLTEVTTSKTLDVNSVNITHIGAPQLNPTSTNDAIKNDNNAALHWLHIIDSDSESVVDMTILYSVQAQPEAISWHNAIIQQFAAKEQSIHIKLVPDKTYSYFKEHDIEHEPELAITTIIHAQNKQPDIHAGIGRHFS